MKVNSRKSSKFNESHEVTNSTAGECLSYAPTQPAVYFLGHFAGATAAFNVVYGMLL
jgi:hypothetical protein